MGPASCCSRPPTPLGVFRADDTPVGSPSVYQVAGGLYAIADCCSHTGATLSSGEVESAQCPAPDAAADSISAPASSCAGRLTLTPLAIRWSRSEGRYSWSPGNAEAQDSAPHCKPASSRADGPASRAPCWCSTSPTRAAGSSSPRPWRRAPRRTCPQDPERSRPRPDLGGGGLWCVRSGCSL
jgi:Rieske [2Fe-2S] domain